MTPCLDKPKNIIIMNKYKYIATITLLLLTISLFPQKKQNNFEIGKSIDIYNSLMRELNLNYVDEINPAELNETAIKAMLKGLDPYTVFIPESEIEDVKLITTGEYGGIGAVIQYDTNYVRISDPYYGFPAQKAGLIAGDLIMQVNGVDTYKKNTAEVSDLLKGQPGTDLTLKIKRYGQDKPIEIKLKREKVKIENIPYSTVLDNGIGYVSLNGFTKNAASELKEKIVEMKKDPNLKGVVIDLRGNGGGLLAEAVDIVNLFLPKNKPIVSTKGKTQANMKSYKTNNNPLDENIRLAILVDGNSASASEIVAGSIQDYDRGIIVGQRTFGKGLVQNILPLTFNTQMKVTVAKYYIPSGRCIQEIDYSHKKDTANATAKADTLGKPFSTANGRTVYEGHGIMPDVKMDMKPYSLVTSYLYGKNMIFDYACKFYNENKTIAEADKFEITDAIFNDFMKFVKDRNFTYVTESEMTLKSLEKAAKEEGYYDKISSQIENLKKQLEEDKANDIIRNRKDIEELLKSEIVGRYYYQTGRIVASLKTDEDLARACEILLNSNGKGEYETILGKK